MKLIDAHAHLQFPQFDNDREAVIVRAREAGIGVINVGTDLATSRGAVELAEAYPDLMWATVGLHPTDIDQKFDGAAFLELARHEKVVAIGECGLDNSKLNPPAGEAEMQSEKEQIKIKNQQKEIFERQIKLAKLVNKPLMIHCRNAYQELLNILENYSGLKGNIHFFAGNWEEAKKFLELGFSLSFTGVITFANQYDEVIKNMPLDRIMIETDCPFVAPVPYRGKRNEPSYLPAVAERLAAIRGLAVDNISEITMSNARRFAFPPAL